MGPRHRCIERTDPNADLVDVGRRQHLLLALAEKQHLLEEAV
jgi:hypothetical protein